jgi:hypothetical protein
MELKALDCLVVAVVEVKGVSIDLPLFGFRVPCILIGNIGGNFVHSCKLLGFLEGSLRP